IVGEIAPDLRREGAHAVEEPLDLAPAAEEDAAQHQRLAALGMLFGVGDGERRAPGAAEHDPAVDAEMAAQPLEVGDQVRRGVVGDLAEWLGAAGAALVEDDDVIVGGIEEAAMHGAGAGARPAMEEYHRRALRVAALLVVDLVRSAHRKIAGRK